MDNQSPRPTSNGMNKFVVSYVPVLHEGYLRLFKKYKDAKLLIFGKEVIKEFTHLSKEIREVDPSLMMRAIESLKVVKEVSVAKVSDLKKLNSKECLVVLPDEDVTREVYEKYFPDAKVKFDPIFLRWDKHKSMEDQPVKADQNISKEEFDQTVIKTLQKEAERSSDWWRRVGAAIVKEGKIILSARNKHVPSDHSPYAEGDPRNNFHKGQEIALSTALHSEAGLIAEAAKKGISLNGASMYVTTFPCPPCAKQIAFSGIKKLYYAGGYSILNQERILKSQGVKIIFVDIV